CFTIFGSVAVDEVGFVLATGSGVVTSGNADKLSCAGFTTASSDTLTTSSFAGGSAGLRSGGFNFGGVAAIDRPGSGSTFAKFVGVTRGKLSGGFGTVLVF